MKEKQEVNKDNWTSGFHQWLAYTDETGKSIPVAERMETGGWRIIPDGMWLPQD